MSAKETTVECQSCGHFWKGGRLQVRIAHADRHALHRTEARQKVEREHGVLLRLVDSWIDPITEDEFLTWEVCL